MALSIHALLGKEFWFLVLLGLEAWRRRGGSARLAWTWWSGGLVWC